jgi:hypothetical protein
MEHPITTTRSSFAVMVLPTLASDAIIKDSSLKVRTRPEKIMVATLALTVNSSRQLNIRLGQLNPTPATTTIAMIENSAKIKAASGKTRSSSTTILPS